MTMCALGRRRSAVKLKWFRIVGPCDGGTYRMPAFYTWMLRLFILVALFILFSILRVIWPDGRGTDWMEIVAIGALVLATLAVSIWAVGAWIGDGPRRRHYSSSTDLAGHTQKAPEACLHGADRGSANHVGGRVAVEE